ERQSLPLCGLSEDRRGRETGPRQNAGERQNGSGIMRPFIFESPAALPQAARLGAAGASNGADAPTQFLAGGTTLIDLMKLDVLRPQRVVNLGSVRAPWDGIETT